MTQTHAGVIHIDALGATVTGQPDVEDFVDLFIEQVTNEEQAHWVVPDLILWAEDTNFDEGWTQVLDGAYLNPRTLANRKSICRKFPKDKRRWKLSQRHYAQLTSLMPQHEALAFELLAQAQRTGMTSEELLAEKKRRINEPVPETFEVTLVVRAGVLVPTVELPTWIEDGDSFNVVLRERAA
jgi:hypothetical protein